jgi:hypothetical protein
VLVAAERGCNGHLHDLLGPRIADREETLALGVPVRRMSRCAHEAEVVLPSQRGNEVVGRQIGPSVLVARADQNEGENEGKAVPDRVLDLEFDIIGQRIRHWITRGRVRVDRAGGVGPRSNLRRLDGRSDTAFARHGATRFRRLLLP